MRILKIICIALVLSACTPPINVDYDNTVNFNSYKTYSNDIQPVRITSDTRISSSFMQTRVAEAIKITLTKNGYTESNNNASFKIKYFLDIKQDIETQESNVMIGFGSYHPHSSVAFGFNFPVGEAYSVDRLVLTIDIVSEKTNNLLWRGSAGYYLGEEGTPAKYEKMINGLVGEILKKFPPNK